MRLLRFKKTVCCAAMFLVLTGCNLSLWHIAPPPQPNAKNGLKVGAVSGGIIGGIAGGSVGLGFGIVAGSIVGASIGDILHSHMDIVKQLQYNGVQVIELGDEIKLILPTDRFFMPNSALMNVRYHKIMDLIAKFIKQFPKITVKVAGYTNNVGEWERNLALSRSQARTVMQYLWNEGIDARLIYAEGFGRLDPIANNATIAGRERNNRIEISLRKIQDYDDF